MRANSMIKTGDRLSLKRVNRIGRIEDTSYISRFLYQTSEGEVVIEMPIAGGVLVALEPGEAFFLSFYTTKGIYQCQSQVVERKYEEKIPVAVLNLQSDFEKLQRRQFYRMECILNLDYRVINSVELRKLLIEKSEGETLQQTNTESKEGIAIGVVLDISGGGVRFNSEVPAKEGDVIALQIAFHTQETAKIKTLFAKVLVVVPVQKKTGLFEHRVEFINIANDEREAIIRFIFLEERKRRNAMRK